MTNEPEKRADIADVVRMLDSLAPVQVEVVHAIIKSFADQQTNELVRSDFLTQDAFEYFAMRLAAHHAFSSHVLKKENFEHILEQAFKRTGGTAQRANSMTLRGADLTVNGVTLSLKTEGAQNLRAAHIVISKLMEAAWIKQIKTTDDIPQYLKKMVLPHFGNYDRIFILRSYKDAERNGFTRYDLREIGKSVLAEIGNLKPEDFSELTRTRTTSAIVKVDGKAAFQFRLDGSDDKLTINQLDVSLCPLHAWWSLSSPT
ncbi:hypothetical protein J2W51_000325 [Tardiphaga robiniae]|uniref:hypothetical protein n=1 Tax=Tardiphaga robiniae TaxID=943830 RepID=UPI00285E8CA7|nr:hypothetical protein [Tardiphaga robiniae]MDR6657783.1 hypothetical protein [Tardiphaga robiniae]